MVSKGLSGSLNLWVVGWTGVGKERDGRYGEGIGGGLDWCEKGWVFEWTSMGKRWVTGWTDLGRDGVVQAGYDWREGG